MRRLAVAVVETRWARGPEKMKMRFPRQPAAHCRETGAVLIVAMIFLIILTMLGVSGMGTTQLEERMASNTQEVFRAFEAAESALAEGIALVEQYDLNNPLNSPPRFSRSGHRPRHDLRSGLYRGVPAP